MSDIKGVDDAPAPADPSDDELDHYRRCAEGWVAEHLVDVRDREASAGSKAERVALARSVQRELHAAGYAGISVPVRYGGQGLHPAYENVFDEARRPFSMSTELLSVSLGIIMPTILRFGTEAQKARYIPELLSGEKIAIQLLSEPSSGSDLAGLITRADQVGDRYLLNGQKIWSSGADHADYGLCPARTDWSAPKHQGISVFIVDLRSPGIDVRPIRQIDGGSEFCEEFLTDVPVSAEDLVGPENGGWQVVRGLLEIEHAWAGRHGTGRRAPGTVDHLLGLVREHRAREADLGERRSIAALHVQIRVHELLADRVQRDIASGSLGATVGSLLKLSSDNLVQRRAELGLLLAGTAVVAWPEDDAASERWSHDYLNSRSASIGGGTREMHRNRIAESALQLPRDRDPYRDVPFSQAPHN